MSGGNRDISSLGNSELLDLWARTEKELPAVEHGGHQNRLARRSRKVIDLLKARTDGTTRFLQPLLSHPDLRLRLTAATLYKSVDHAAYRAATGELAQRQDAIGRAARESLEWDATSAQYSTSSPTPEQLRRLSEAANRRVSRPPPEGLSRAALEERLRAEFPADLTATLLALARPAIGLWPQRLAVDAPVTASRFGGMPCVPAGWSWPTCEGEPLFFLAQINCRDLAHLPGAARLPRDGMLAFFGDHDWVNGFPNFWPYAAVEYWPNTSTLRFADSPVDDFEVMPSCALRFFETFELPHPLSEAIEQLQLDEASSDRYWDFHMARGGQVHGVRGSRDQIDISKMFGWPDLIQRDIEAIEGEGREGWSLLLQIGSYENGTESHGWGPGGNLYFMIRDADLAAQDFDLCNFAMQCT
jgi:uncharacterized protein YwqG